jgi:Tfp pilus assembly protein PilV
VTRITRTPRRAARRRSARQQGAVLLVVLLVIMMATASAMLALHTVLSELRASGNQRVALQTRGVADAAMVTTIAWIDLLGSTNQWLSTLEMWRTNGPPDMGAYPEPAIDPILTHGFASRTTMAAQRHLNIAAANEVGVVCNQGAGASGSGGSGGSGSAGAGGGGGSGGSSSASGDGCDSSFDQANLVGSFGPHPGYAVSDVGYVVDITDCMLAPAALAPGSPLGGGSSYDVIAFNCTVTARGRLEIDATTRSWNYGSTPAYTQRVFESANDARATIVTPEMIVSK